MALTQARGRHEHVGILEKKRGKELKEGWRKKKSSTPIAAGTRTFLDANSIAYVDSIIIILRYHTLYIH